VPSLLICCLCGKSFCTRAERANDVRHIISGPLHSWMRLSFVCLVPMDLRGKAQRTHPQVQGPQDRDKTAGPSSVFGCCAPQGRGRRTAARGRARANRSRSGQRSRPIQGSTGLPEHRGVFRSSQAVSPPRLLKTGPPLAAKARSKPPPGKSSRVPACAWAWSLLRRSEISRPKHGSLVSPLRGGKPRFTDASHRIFGAGAERHPRRQSGELLFRSPGAFLQLAQSGDYPFCVRRRFAKRRRRC